MAWPLFVLTLGSKNICQSAISSNTTFLLWVQKQVSNCNKFKEFMGHLLKIFPTERSINFYSKEVGVFFCSWTLPQTWVYTIFFPQKYGPFCDCKDDMD